MPDFSTHRMKRVIPEKGLMRDLYETKKDIRKAKRGEETEASLPEMRQTKRRIRDEIKAEVMEERKAMLRQLDPLQPAQPRMRPKTTTADTFKLKTPAGIAAARG